MSSEFTDSFTQTGDDSVPNPESTRPFDNDGYLGYDPRLSSQRYDFVDSESLKDSATDSPIFHGSAGGNAYGANPVPDSPSSPLIYTDSNGKGFDGGFGGSDGPILPPPTELEPEEGYALREWRRENAIRLEEKEKREKELLNQIIEEADEFKLEFYQKRKVAMESNKTANREKEKSFLDSQEKFHAEVSNNYWKAIAELIPNEVPTIEKRGKKEKEKKPSVTVIQGPKPGKPTDLSRMRQILVKLKHNTPPHLKPSPPSQPGDGAKNSGSGSGGGGGVVAPPKAAAVATPSKAVVAA